MIISCISFLFLYLIFFVFLIYAVSRSKIRIICAYNANITIIRAMRKNFWERESFRLVDCVCSRKRKTERERERERIRATDVKL